MSLLSLPLQAFYTVAEFGTVHGAAEQLHITQTAVTARLRVLENQLNAALFIRSRRGMQLTPEGEALLRYCQTVLAMEGETLAKIKGIGKDIAIQVVIKGPSSIMTTRIISDCTQLLTKFPHLLWQFDIDDSEHREQALKAGQCQFAILTELYLAQEMERKKLQPEDYVLVASYQWRKKSLMDILSKERIIDFNPDDQMTLNYLKYFELQYKQYPERHFVNRPESLAAMIAEGYGYGVLTKEFAEQYIERKELILLNQGETYHNFYYLAWYPRPEMPSYFTEIITSIQ